MRRVRRLEGSATSLAPPRSPARQLRGAEVRRQEEHGRRAGAVEVERVGRARVEEDRVAFLEFRLEVDASGRAARDVVDLGGGAAASSSVQIAVRTVDLPLDASPTSAHIEPGTNSSSRAAR